MIKEYELNKARAEKAKAIPWEDVIAVRVGVN